MSALDQHSPEWHEERRKGIGGSDWGDVLGIEPWGCPRRLWYRKTAVQEDYPKQQTGAMLRGNKLEEMVAREYAERTGHKVRRPGRLAKQDIPDWWIGNLDRVVVERKPSKGNPGNPKCVLECKTVNPGMWRKIQSSAVPEPWVLQCNHYMVLSGYGVAALAVLEPLDWKFQIWAIPFDQSLVDAMVTAGNRFWRMVENGPAPDRLDASDKRCQRCEYRLTCQGSALFGCDPARDAGDVEEMEDSALSDLIDQRQEIQDIVNQAATELETINDRIRNHLGRPRKVSIPGYRVYLTESVSTRLDTKRIKEEMPEIAEKYSTQSKSQTLRVIAG